MFILSPRFLALPLIALSVIVALAQREPAKAGATVTVVKACTVACAPSFAANTSSVVR